MSGGVVDARIALETRLNAIASPLATQWENAVYVPLQNVPYQKVNLLFAEPDNPEMGRYYQEIGFLQIALRYPENVGSGTTSAKAQAIRDWFYRGLVLAANGLSVVVDRTPSISAGFYEADRYVVIIRIPFVANNAS